MVMPPLRVLIRGASVAGPALAYWLVRAGVGCIVTTVERAPSLRVAGQGLDVIKRMAIFERMHTGEKLARGRSADRRPFKRSLGKLRRRYHVRQGG